MPPPSERIANFLRCTRRASNGALIACAATWVALCVFTTQLWVLVGSVPDPTIGHIMAINALAATSVGAAGIRWMTALIARAQLAGLVAPPAAHTVPANGRPLRVADH